MRVLGISGISNKANLDGNTMTTHEEVLSAGEDHSSKTGKINQGAIAKGLITGRGIYYLLFIEL